MLRELPNVQQVPNEPLRRWFFSHELDLVVFFGADGQPCAFQLAYDKYRGERSISWHHETGYRHYVVDDGETATGGKRTPLLYADGPIRKDRVLAQFLAQASSLPHEIGSFVAEKLRAMAGDDVV